jgi:hypothetical protein
MDNSRQILILLCALLICCSVQSATASGGPNPIFSTYLGGSGFDEGFAAATDASGNVYVTGLSSSPFFPGNNIALFGSDDLFIAKFSPSGQLLYSTRIGGSSFDEAFSIAVDQSGNVYVAGQTGSPDFPVTGGFQTVYGGGFSDAFILKLDPSGNLVYSSYLGGSGGNEALEAIAVDGSGNAYVAGRTDSLDFPVSNAYQSSFRGGIADGFVARINTNTAGTASLMYSTYLGGSGFDSANAVAVDASGNAYVTGGADCCFPTTSNAFQTFIANAYAHAFVSEFDRTACSCTRPLSVAAIMMSD